MAKGSFPEQLIGPLLTSQATRQQEFKRRKEPFKFQNVHPADVQKYEIDGWVVQKEGSKRARMKRPKSHDQTLEDQAWCLLYRMGYPELGARKFTIRYKRPNNAVGEKQVDAFGKDDETVVVAECKSRETRGRKSLQKDLHETESLQKPFADSIRAHYGNSFNPKIIWMYITNNIIWSQPDLERAEAINVRIVTENEMQYFDAFARYMGAGGRFQFLSEYLGGQPIPELSNIRVPAIRGTLGKNTFYSFVATPRHLLKIAFVNHLALNHPEGRPAYQRMITPSRLKEIGRYIKDGGFFPTNILVNFIEKCRFDLLSNKENVDTDTKFGWLYLPNKYKSAWIIDGQHRLYAYSRIDEKYWDQPIPVIAFECIDRIHEADLFVTINHKQKSVPRSVIESLNADLKWGSEDARERLSALGSRLVKTLNADPTSPFFQRFAVQGVVAKENQSLTLPEVVKGLYASQLIGRSLPKGNLVPGALSSSTDDKTIERAKRVLNGYFEAIRGANPQRWEAARQSYVSVNPGIRAHLTLIADVIRYLQAHEDLDPALLDEENLVNQVIQVIQPVVDFIQNAPDAEIQAKFSRRFGEGGVREYADSLSELIYAQKSTFGSTEFKARLARRSDERAKVTNFDVIELAKNLNNYVFDVLKHHYGEEVQRSGDRAYWEKGIESTKIKQEAYNKQLQDGSKHPKEAYLDIVQLKEIVTQKQNWHLFQAVFDIQLPDEKKGQQRYVRWMDKFNEIRRIPAHPSGARTYDEADYEFMKFIIEQFYSKQEAAQVQQK